MNWIKTDIEIGYRIKCFEFDAYKMYELSPPLGINKWDVKVLELLFEELRDKGHFPKTAKVSRITMPPDRMVIQFFVQDNSFEPVKDAFIIPIEQIREYEKDKKEN